MLTQNKNKRAVIVKYGSQINKNIVRVNNINNSGAYKVYNNLNDFKKLLFLGIFLIQILKKQLCVNIINLNL